jgi:hypothetical protein
MSQRVRIGSCANPADAALVRSMFDAHGISAIVGGEHHAGLLGGFGGGFISLDIFVTSDDAEEASALLADLRAGERSDEADVGEAASSHPDGADAADAAATAEASFAAEAMAAGNPVSDADIAEDPDFDARLLRRRRTIVAVALAMCVTFGTAHFYARAWIRGILLAGLEITGFARFGGDKHLGASFVITAIVIDLVGAVLVIRGGDRIAPLPRARIRR